MARKSRKKIQVVTEENQSSEQNRSESPLNSPPTRTNKPVTRLSTRLSLGRADNNIETIEENSTRKNFPKKNTRKNQTVNGETSHISKKLKTTTNTFEEVDESKLNETDIDYIVPRFPSIQSKLKSRNRKASQDDVLNQDNVLSQNNNDPNQENNQSQSDENLLNITNVTEKLEETNRILEQVRTKQKLIESNYNTESAKREQSFKEFKQFSEENFQNYERRFSQLQNNQKREEENKFKTKQIYNLEHDLQNEKETRHNLEKDLQKEKEKSKKLINQLQQLKQEMPQIENSINSIGDLKQTIKRLEFELRQENENNKKLKRELDKIPTQLDTKQLEILSQLNLYQDLSNLLIQNVKIVSQVEKSFTCILNGRNGSLVFKLTFNGDEYLYEPCINQERDAELLKILPDYLREEISFKKDNSDLFFWRALNFLQKRESD
ncbi:6375_t:CDS:1 [Diversispora eburnea]|uniref:6375_t:CDS:1 n=1 Tax=Diversispora eburnea TaxID=1213867 RepID=A0A9N8WF45_9GLOM|nr:6375_t:CDS:1 [Diversispora eburnea]